jgi:hypothetical protein
VREVEEEVMGELAPPELAQIGLARGAGRVAHRVPDAARRHLAEVQMG